jgi:hypothetical protein
MSLNFPCYRRQKLSYLVGLSGRVFERSELSSAPFKWFIFWKQGDEGAFFFGSVSFGHPKEMNAQRQRQTSNQKNKLRQ